MPLTKTLLLALVIVLVVRRVWDRTRAGIQEMMPLGGASPTRSSPATRLPLELVKIIIAYLIFDARCLRACAMTCRSWYIVAVPHLHRTLTIKAHSYHPYSGWPIPLQRMHALGLLPLVKCLWVYGCNYNSVGLSPNLFNSCTLDQFSALTNVRELEVEYLDIPNFIWDFRRYFKHFLPTLTSLGLREPRGSDRQVIYFVGLFKHLQDLKLIYSGVNLGGGPADDLTLVPAFVPPLQGDLFMMCFTKVGLLKDMIDLFGGIRFWRMTLYDVDGMQLLLDAGAETLEALALDPTDPRAESSLRDFNLSRNKSLRGLYIPARCIDGSPGTTSFLKYVVSTITPSASLKIYLYHGEYYFRTFGAQFPDWRQFSRAKRKREVSRYHRRFEVLREVHKVRGFQLVLRTSIWGHIGEEPVRMLEEAIAEENAKGGFDRLPCELSVVYNPREFREGSHRSFLSF